MRKGRKHYTGEEKVAILQVALPKARQSALLPSSPSKEARFRVKH
jgi:hypothetical protein